MFRYLARRHDRKHIFRSIKRQERMADRSIDFAYDAHRAFMIDESDKYYDSDSQLAFTDIEKGEKFFAALSPGKPLLELNGMAIFESDIKTETIQNNQFDCVISDSGLKEHAIVVFHHWYARNRYTAFSRFFAARGITVIEVTLPYHFNRGSDDGSEEKLFNANLGQTVRSIRQAVLDGRKVVRWLHNQGYEKISVVGMCLGGTVAGLIAAQETKVSKAVLMVTPGSPADLVWTAETMKPLRGRIEPAISLDELRSAWSLIDLENHLWSLARPRLDMMFVLGKDDTIARPNASERVIEHLSKCNCSPEVIRLNCGHSSVGIFPYNIIAARKVLRFLKGTPSLKEMWEMRGFRIDLSGV